MSPFLEDPVEAVGNGPQNLPKSREIGRVKPPLSRFQGPQHPNQLRTEPAHRLKKDGVVFGDGFFVHDPTLTQPDGPLKAKFGIVAREFDWGMLCPQLDRGGAVIPSTRLKTLNGCLPV